MWFPAQGDSTHCQYVHRTGKVLKHHTPAAPCEKGVPPSKLQEKRQIQFKIKANPTFISPVGSTTWSVEQKSSWKALNNQASFLGYTLRTNGSIMAVQWIKSHWVLYLTSHMSNFSQTLLESKGTADKYVICSTRENGRHSSQEPAWLRCQ